MVILSRWYACQQALLSRYGRGLLLGLVLLIITLAVSSPQRFMNMWLTQDQQGFLKFVQGNYVGAAQHFSDPHWQAHSFYGAEAFDQTALVFSQMRGADARLGQANALAQASRYVEARDLYQVMLIKDPSDARVPHNLTLVQTIIDDINRLSASQKQEMGDSPKELGDEAKRADGADRLEARRQTREQLTSEQLLLDSALNAMWLRQVQKDPRKFIALKFQLQWEQGVGAEFDGVEGRDAR